MSNARDKVNRYQEQVEADDLFDIEYTGETVDPTQIMKMRKYVTHFRLMALIDAFPGMTVGSHLVFNGRLDSPHGIVTSTGQIKIPDMDNEVVHSLTAFARKVMPQTWVKKSGKDAGKPIYPDGWNRVSVLQDDNSTVTVEKLLFEHYDKTGYTVEQLKNIPFLHDEMRRMGIYTDDLEDDLKTWKSRNEPSKKGKKPAKDDAKSK